MFGYFADSLKNMFFLQVRRDARQKKLYQRNLNLSKKEAHILNQLKRENYKNV